MIMGMNNHLENLMRIGITGTLIPILPHMRSLRYFIYFIYEYEYICYYKLQKTKVTQT